MKVDEPMIDDGHQEGVPASDEVAEPAEHQGTEGPHQEARRERQQCEDVTGGSRQTG